MKVPLGFTVLTIICVGLACSAPADPAFPAPLVHVERSSAGVRLSASAAPLPAVLAEVRRVARVSVEGLQHLSEVITMEFDLPLDLAVRRLMHGYSFVLIEGHGEAKLRILGPAVSTPTSAQVESVRSPETGTSLEALRSSGDVERLARLISEEALQVILEASGSAELDARLEALSALAQIGQEALGILTTAVVDPDPTVRLTAVRFLAGAGKEAVSHLLTVFREVKDSDLRILVLSAVAAFGGTASEDILALAARDSDPKVRAHAQDLSRSVSSANSVSGE
jgi:hypothetical protein